MSYLNSFFSFFLLLLVMPMRLLAVSITVCTVFDCHAMKVIMVGWYI